MTTHGPRADRPGYSRSCAASPWSARLGDDTGLAVKQPTSTARTSDAGLAPVPSHTDTLMRSTLAACAAVDVSRVGAVLKVVPAGSHQGSLNRSRPLFVGLSQAPNLVRGQAKVSERSPERLTVVDAIQELPTFLHRQPFLCPPPEACPGGLVLRFTACVTVTPFQPAGRGAVGRLRATSAAMGVSKLPTSCNCRSVHGGPAISPRESQRRTTGGVTLHTAAAWRTEVIAPERLTIRTLAPHRSPLRDLIPRDSANFEAAATSA